MTFQPWEIFFQQLKSHFLYFSQANMNFLAWDKIFDPGEKYFVQDNFYFVLDKNYFVWAEVQGISVAFVCYVSFTRRLETV